MFLREPGCENRLWKRAGVVEGGAGLGVRYRPTQTVCVGLARNGFLLSVGGHEAPVCRTCAVVGRARCWVTPSCGGVIAFHLLQTHPSLCAKVYAVPIARPPRPTHAKL